MMDLVTMGTHGVLAGMLAWVLRAMHVNGWRVDIHIWRNGKSKDDE
jgi:hypothetical protein